jgi:hypothetical protein
MQRLWACWGWGRASAVLLALGACGGPETASDGSAPSEGAPASDSEEAPPGAHATETNWTGLSGLDDPENPPPEGGQPLEGAAADRPVCPQCAAAGGETSDFGDDRPLTPCELSAESESLEVAAAGALGFADALDALDTSFEVPFEWTAGTTEPESPASGYAASTRLRGSTRVAAVVHQVPSLAGCADWLDVSLDTSLATADGALSIAGRLRARVERDTPVASALGRLDLSQARGSLALDPPPTPEPLVGFVRAQLYVWPDDVRLTLAVGAELASEVGSDTPSYHYEPLFGMGPIDACAIEARPYAFEAATPSTGDATFAARFAELSSFVAAGQPLSARWQSGATTTLSVELGEPLSVCDDGRRVTASLAYRVQSADGRVDIDTDGHLSIAFDGAAPGRGWVNASSSELPVSTDEFASSAGVSGVDFQGYGGGIWHSMLRFDPAEQPALGAELSVEAHDLDGSVSGFPGSYGGVVDTLRW